MLRFMLAVLIGLGGKAVFASTATVPAADKAERSVVQGNNRFALELYGKLNTEKGNLFLSPYSISTALAMTYAGAGGQTAEQMAQTLHFELPADRLHPAFAQLINGLNEAGRKGDFQLVVANALWGQKGEGFRQDFLDLTNRHYRAGLNEVDFMTAAEQARRTINTWVEKQTQDRIQELIKPGVLGRDSRLVLTNAIYFKGRWSVPFKPDRTRDEPFTLADGKKVAVPMMFDTGHYKYLENDQFQAIELGYAGKRLAMTIFLPKRTDELPAFEKTLTSANLAKWLPKLRSQEVVVILPKFKMTAGFTLAKVLSQMGMTDAFNPSADFSGINGRKDLFISAVLHKAFVDVNEAGTEAAAATAIVAAEKSAPKPKPKPVVFKADHPFVFMIRDLPTGSILFVGRVADPTSN